jgi:signal transduction histidine kinase
MSATASQPATKCATGEPPKGRTTLAHLLHALNQPLTGLQCSLELALSSQKRADQYMQTLRDGLDLTARMRDLVAAIRELVDMQQSEREEAETLLLDELLKETVAELLPIAESRQVNLQLEANTNLPMREERHRLKVLAFHLLESVLSLTRKGGDLRVSVRNDGPDVLLMLSWSPGASPEHSPFSRPELGLLIAQAGWEQFGGKWIQSRTEQCQNCSMRLPLESSQSQPQPKNLETSN